MEGENLTKIYRNLNLKVFPEVLGSKICHSVFKIEFNLNFKDLNI